jgi:membrane protein YdbS with pleckstrin-like domain
MNRKKLEDQTYFERITSSGTTRLFLFLAVLFMLLFAWRFLLTGWRIFSGILLILTALFIFYVINYRVLEITITTTHLKLKFGIISSKTILANIQSVDLDNSPPVIKYGGAGVHFAFVKGQYRAFYNFLEYPRILVNLKKKQGWVKALVFSSRQPDKVIEILNKRITQL